MKTKLSQIELFPKKLKNPLLLRAKKTIQLVLYSLYGNIADIGETNPLKQMFEGELGVPIGSLDWDFNKTYYGLEKKYDNILCFEVLEHVMNPLLFLKQLKRLLKENGSIYLSTPYQFPQIIKVIHHYHEIPTDRLIWLFNEAGLKYKLVGKITIAGKWYEHIHGIRPILRYFQKTRLYRLYI